jgi:hypothetical protein
VIKINKITSPLILFETTHDILWFLLFMTINFGISFMIGWIKGYICCEKDNNIKGEQNGSENI